VNANILLNLAKRLVKFSWLIIILTSVSAILSFQFLSAPTYQANITLGLNFNNPKFLETKQDSVFVEQPNFLDTQGKLSRYLENRLASIDSQQIIVKELELLNLNLNSDRPIYKLTDQELGFITISYSTNQKTKAEKFNQVMQQQVYPNIVKEWNDSRLENFQISAIQSPSQNIQEISSSIQTKLIAPVAAFVITSLLVILWPIAFFKMDKNLEENK